MYQNSATRVLTGEVRLSYVNLVTPAVNKLNPSADARYSVTLLIPKSDTATYQDIMQSIEAAATDAQTRLWGGHRPPNLPIPIHDGDGLRENGTPFNPECKGMWVITANSTHKPQVVHKSNINVELDPRDIYSGMYARVTINFFGYNNTVKRGIGCALGNVMKTREGEPLSGATTAAADFAGIGDSVETPAEVGMNTQQTAWGTQPAMQINPITGQPVTV